MPLTNPSLTSVPPLGLSAAPGLARGDFGYVTEIPAAAPSRILAVAQFPPAQPAATQSGAPSAAPTLKFMADGVSTPQADAPAALNAGFDGEKPHQCGACSGDGVPAAPPAGAPPSAPSVGRLPDAIRPRRYDVKLSLEPQAGTFRGRVSIAALVAKPTDRVVLHALDLSFSEIRVNGKAVDASRVVIDPKSETVTLLLDKPLAKGSVALEFAYEGRMSELMRGLYKAKAKGDGKDEAWSFTHLEPTHARRVLPSFDEPGFKAVFALTIEAPEHLTPISNMPAVSRVVKDGRVTVTFADSPKMSSYLLAVFAARLQPKSRMVGKTLVTVWAAADQLDQAEFALDAAEKALKTLEKYFGMPYQLPKLDLVAAPDFASGAMENWGAILFRDVNVLVDPKLTSDAAKRRVAEVVSHEIAHQWFGNLVTMKWWNDLWLNEAFATWVAAKVVDSYRPEWKVWDEFDAGKRSPLSIDALPGTRPVRSDAQNPAEIQALFDPITYQKGGALLRMLEDWIGERDFRRGIQAYMKRHQYKNAEASDLWREIERVSGKPVRRVAGAWLSQAGVPVIGAAAASADGRTLTLTQKRFTAMGAAPETQWPVPLAIRYQLKGQKKTRVFRTLLDGREATIRLPGKGELLWAYPNASETGYYRLALDARLLTAAAAAAKRGELSPVERAGLLNQLWAQVRAGSLPVADFLGALEQFKGDRSRLVIEDAAGYLKTLRQDLAQNDEQRSALGAFAQGFFGPHAKRLGWAPKRGEDDDAAQARPAVLSALALHGDAARLAPELSLRLASYLKDPAELDPAVAPVVVAASARRNDPALFDQFRALLAAPRTPEQKDVMLKALSEFTAPALLDRYLAMTLSEDIRQQDAWKPFIYLLGNAANRDRAFEFLKANWPAFLAKVGPRGATRVIAAAAGLVSASRRDEVAAFFRDPHNEVEMARPSLAQALSAIDLGLSFKAAQRASFAAWAAARPK